MELKKIERDENGLIKGIEYKFDENGLVDWRAMVPKSFLYLNNAKKEQIEKKYGKELDKIDIETDKVEDKDLIVNLAGIKFLSFLRKYNSVTYSVKAANLEFAAAACEIEWSPNYETENQTIKFQSLASASINNTKSFAQNYLVEMAENRAFCRAVRNFLRINIVSSEELGNGEIEQDNPTQSADTTINELEQLLNEKNITFEFIKEKLIIEKFDGANDFKSLNDVPKFKRIELIDRLKKYAGKKSKNKDKKE